MSSEGNLPTVARVSHVEAIITKEPAFHGMLGPRTAQLRRRDGQMIQFYEHSLGIAQMIHDAGIDAVSLSKADVLDRAKTYFTSHGGPNIPASVTATAAPVETNQTTISTTIAEDDKGKKTSTTTRTTAPRSKNYGLAVYSLIGAALEIAKLDTTQGAKERVDKLNAALQAYHSETLVA